MDDSAKSPQNDAKDGPRQQGDGLDYPQWMFWKRRRYVVTLMAFFGFFNVFALRVNVSVAITAMTEENVVNGTQIKEPEFDWSPELKGYVLSSYFYGYITTQILGGWLAARVGGNILFGSGIAVTAVLTLITPTLAKISVYWFIAIRVIEGVFEGVSYPSMHDVWGHWAPPLERSRFATIAYSGAYFGTVVAMTLSGVLATHAGWPSVFFVFGGFGCLWSISWFLLVRRSPVNDHMIEPSELQYLQESLGSNLEKKESVPTPWSKIFLSLPVWAIVVANFSETWGFYTLMTGLPTFMNDVLGFNIQNSGILSSLPYIVVALMIQVAGHIADWLLRSKHLSVTQVRKAFCSLSFLGQCAFMLAAAFFMAPAAAITCLTLAVGVGAFAIAGFLVNHFDIAPAHASVLMGIGNTAGSIPGIISPIITGYITTDKTKEQWQIVFYIASGIYLFGAVFYGMFGSGEKQSWAEEGK